MEGLGTMARTPKTDVKPFEISANRMLTVNLVGRMGLSRNGDKPKVTAVACP
jgi:hypothetical protein